MVEHPIDQSAKSRAWEDTKAFFHKPAWFVFVEVIGMGGFSYLSEMGYLPLFHTAVWTAIGAVVAFGFVFLFNLVYAPFKQRNEARIRVQRLEEERIPVMMTSPNFGHREGYRQHGHLMWAELEVCNTNTDKTLEDVGVQVAGLEYVMPKQDAPAGHYVIVKSFPKWNRTGIYWSESTVSPVQLRQPLNPGEVKTALIAFQDNPNGGTAIFNTPMQPKPWIEGGAKIKVQVTGCGTAMWEGDFYIECHPNYFKGDRAKFEFVEWGIWAANRNITLLDSDKGDSQT